MSNLLSDLGAQFQRNTRMAILGCIGIVALFAFLFGRIDEHKMLAALAALGTINAFLSKQGNLGSSLPTAVSDLEHQAVREELGTKQ